MTDTSAQTAKMPLGVGAIISSSLSIMFGNFGKVFLLGFAGAFLGFIINFLFLGFDAATGSDPVVNGNPTAFLLGSLVSMVINMAIYGLITALLIQLAYDAKLGRQNSLSTYFKSALPAVLPIAVLSIVIGILSAIGAIALLIGALWVYAVFYVTAPVAVIERGGFGSMGRSENLTKEYRWPIVGLFILVLIVTIVLQLIGIFLVGVIAAIGGQFIAGVGLAMITGLAYALGGIAVALVYARLREIKEGVDVDQIASVFE
ncbi:hypothetical protein [Tateyamaria sp.]|uniref:hypothetical protein n=1 Tax=Tateyamaria sp. TaxID=1929288 RepID=UPI00329F4221